MVGCVGVARDDIAATHQDHLPGSATCQQLNPNHRGHREGHARQCRLDMFDRRGAHSGTFASFGSPSLQAWDGAQSLVHGRVE
jgi:hypothetical protein